MRHFFVLLLLNLSLFAYIENFNAYSDGTQSTDLNNSGISLSSKGKWEVFTTPFSIFTTPVLLEPSSSSDNSPLTLSLQETQCSFSLDFATDGKDTLNVIGFYRGQEVYQQQFTGKDAGGSYVNKFEINTKLDAVKISTLNRERLLIDNIETTSCNLDSYNLTENMLAHYAFEKNTSASVKGVIGNALLLETPFQITQEKVESIALWFNASAIEDAPTLLQSVSDDAPTRMRVSINNSGLLQLDFNDALLSPFHSDIALTSNTWNHLVLTQDSKEFKVYINGKLQGSYSMASHLLEAGENIEIGDHNFGMIDELRLYTRELNHTEISELYHTKATFLQTHNESYSEGFSEGKQFCIDNPQECGLRVGSTTQDISIAKDIETLQGETFDIKWHLWSTSNGIYLISGDSNASSIWQMVPDTRQWKPVHNAGSFDGFEAQDTLFDSIILSDDGKQITFGNELNTTEEN